MWSFGIRAKFEATIIVTIGMMYSYLIIHFLIENSKNFQFAMTATINMICLLIWKLIVFGWASSNLVSVKPCGRIFVAACATPVNTNYNIYHGIWHCWRDTKFGSAYDGILFRNLAMWLNATNYDFSISRITKNKQSSVITNPEHLLYMMVGLFVMEIHDIVFNLL